MPERKTIERARRDKSEGKAATTQAGEFVREEIEHVREGKHGARSAKQAIAIGLSKARRAGYSVGRSESEDHERRDAEEGCSGFAARRRESGDERGGFDKTGQGPVEGDEA